MREARTHLDRRRLLRGGGAGVAAAGLAAALQAPSATQAQAYDPGAKETRARYRADAADVQAFYRTNGYETLKKK